MPTDVDFERLTHDTKYRLNTLYHITDKRGNDIPFRLNPVQEDVLDNLHNRNVILKARQLGMSTFSVLYLFDAILWTPNLNAGIVSYSRDHAKHIFKKIIGYALKHLPSWFRVDVVSQSAHEISFDNGSSLHIDTTLRGGTCQLVLVTEFGKTCARSPIKAEEVVTGTLESVADTGTIIIESTAEGNEGYFCDMVTGAELRKDEALTLLDYKLFFYSWLDEKKYTLDATVNISTEEADYFAKIEKELEITITPGQKAWYVTKKKTLGEKMPQEYPSTVKEAFLASTDAYYFAEAIAKAYSSNRCLYTSLYDFSLPVYVAMDIGVNDLTVMTFFQLAHGEVRILDYYEDKNKDVPFYVDFLLKEKTEQ